MRNRVGASKFAPTFMIGIIGSVFADVSLVKTTQAQNFPTLAAAWPVLYGAAAVSLLVAVGRALREHINHKVAVNTPSKIRQDSAGSCNLRCARKSSIAVSLPLSPAPLSQGTRHVNGHHTWLVDWANRATAFASQSGKLAAEFPGACSLPVDCCCERHIPTCPLCSACQPRRRDCGALRLTLSASGIVARRPRARLTTRRSSVVALFEGGRAPRLKHAQ